MVFKRTTRDYLLHLDADELTFHLSRYLRKSMTEAEKVLWEQLKNRKCNGLKFRRQHPVHWYIADFYCHEKRLAIEIDGGIHMKSAIREHDENRSVELDRLGISVLRFTNEQVMNDIDKVLQEILEFVCKTGKSNSPSPSGEGAGG